MNQTEERTMARLAAHNARLAAQHSTSEATSEPAAEQGTYTASFAAAYCWANSATGGWHQVPLSIIRPRLASTREAQDRVILLAVRSGDYCLEREEGRYGLPADLAAAALADSGEAYHYVARRYP